MCSLCGALGKGPAWEQTGLSGDNARWLLRREAVDTAKYVSDLLAVRRIKVTSHPDHGFVVAFATGRTEIARSLGEIWHILVRHDIAIPDPLEAA